MDDLAGKTAFVTGAASGIGLGIAGALAHAGVKVMLCDIEEAALAKAVEELKRTNADVDGVKAVVSLKAESGLRPRPPSRAMARRTFSSTMREWEALGRTAHGPTPDGIGRSASI